MSPKDCDSVRTESRVGFRIVMITGRLPAGDKVGSLASVARQIDSIRELGHACEVVEVAGPPVLKYASAVLRVRALARAADAVHAHYGFCGWVGLLQRRRPVVCSFMGSDLLAAPDRYGRRLLPRRLEASLNRLSARWYDAVIVKSAAMAALIHKVPSHVVPNGVDTRVFLPSDQTTARSELGWDADARYVLFGGDPARHVKNYPLAASTVQIVKAMGVDAKLVALHEVSPSLVPRFMNAADALLVTSFHEGSPNVVKEALACNLPVISVDVGDVRVLLDGVSPSAVCAPNPGELAQAIAHVLTSQARSNGRTRLRELGLGADEVAARVCAVYERVISSAHHQARRTVSSPP